MEIFGALVLGVIIGAIGGWQFALAVTKRIIDDYFEKKQITRFGKTYRLEEITAKDMGRLR